VVVNDIPENAIAAGVPARVVGHRAGVNEGGLSNSDARKISVIA
jgi:acetyltransferase-like isoleucine patch superfamily enzyme